MSSAKPMSSNLVASSRTTTLPASKGSVPARCDRGRDPGWRPRRATPRLTRRAGFPMAGPRRRATLGTELASVRVDGLGDLHRELWGGHRIGRRSRRGLPPSGVLQVGSRRRRLARSGVGAPSRSRPASGRGWPPAGSGSVSSYPRPPEGVDDLRAQPELGEPAGSARRGACRGSVWRIQCEGGVARTEDDATRDRWTPAVRGAG